MSLCRNVFSFFQCRCDLHFGTPPFLSCYNLSELPFAKSPLRGLLLALKDYKTKPPSTEFYFCQGRVIYISRGATLIHIHFSYYVLLQDTNISPATDVCPHVAEYSKSESVHSSLAAPSVVHLTTCVPTFLSIRSLCKCTNCFYLHINGFFTAVFNFQYITALMW